MKQVEGERERIASTSVNTLLAVSKLDSNTASFGQIKNAQYSLYSVHTEACLSTARISLGKSSHS